MLRTNILRFAGWAFILAAVCLLVSFRPDAAQMRVGLERFFGVPRSVFADQVLEAFSQSIGVLPLILANMLITFGLVGMRVRYVEQTDRAAQLALEVGILGGVAAVVGGVFVFTGAVQARYAMNLAMAVMFGGLFVFGLNALRVKPMAHGNGLPVLASIWWLLIVIASYGYQLLAGRGPNVPHTLSFALFLGMSGSLAWLGYVLQADGEQTLPQTMNRQFTEARK